MPEEHLDHLIQLRDELLNALEEADRELSALRMRVERLESDVRIGRPEAPEFAEAKGHLLPRAEAVIVELYRDLQKLEDKINTARLRETAV
jgi:hypothetical protein